MSTVCSDYTGNDRGTAARAISLGEGRTNVKTRFLRPIASQIVSTLGQIALWPARVLAARRELEMLAHMSDYELKDIGLTTADVADVTALPADMSPTEFLAARVEERHRARHA